MSFTITEAFVNQYASNFLTLSQQRESRLEPFVTVESGIVGASKAVERIGSAEAYQLTSRRADTQYLDTPHSRRWIDLIDYAWADTIDEMDKIKALIDPTSPYLAAAVNALNRKKDDVIITSLGASARTGGSAATFSNTIVHGSVGLTVSKIATAKQMMDEAEVEDTDRVFVATSEQITNLLTNTTAPLITSFDYMNVKALVNGEVDTLMGFKFIRSERLPKASTTRTCYAFAKSRVALGIGKDITTSIDVLPGKNMTTQVYARMSLGAVRLEELGVVGIECTETA